MSLGLSVSFPARAPSTRRLTHSCRGFRPSSRRVSPYRGAIGSVPTANLTTTSRYLNINRRELHRAMRQFEESPQSIADLAQSLHNRSGSAPVVVQQPNDGSPTKSSVSWRLKVVRKGGFEPPRCCHRQPLKLVRLPVPPLPRLTAAWEIESSCAVRLTAPRVLPVRRPQRQARLAPLPLAGRRGR